MRIPLLALAVAAFGIGTSEFIIMGLLPNLSVSFHVSIPKAGMLVSGYALSVTIGSPLVAIAVSRLERKTALLLLMGLFTLGNLSCALAPTYNLLFAARVLTALCHGAFFGIGSIVAAAMVDRTQRTQAIALMFSGLTLANVLGVPAGTALGQALGWRSSFWAIVPIGLAAVASLFFLVPRQGKGESRLLDEFIILRRPQVLLVLGMSTLLSSSLFCVFTYVTPTLEMVTGFSPHAVTVVLLLFGVGITLGNLLGARLSDWRQMPAIISTMISVILMLLLLFFAEPFAMPMVAAVLVWGLAQFAAGSPLQARIVDQASSAPNLASTLNQGAFNLGNAAGASLGGLLLSAGYSYRILPWGSIAVTAAALALARWSALLDRKENAAFTSPQKELSYR
jgi:MFS transporter, DHA1 family, inner membrane transport protein